jgi:hypothetical protein
LSSPRLMASLPQAANLVIIFVADAARPSSLCYHVVAALLTGRAEINAQKELSCRP